MGRERERERERLIRSLNLFKLEIKVHRVVSLAL